MFCDHILSFFGKMTVPFYIEEFAHQCFVKQMETYVHGSSKTKYVHKVAKRSWVCYL